MANCAIVGINWGDEGKGRMVDYLTERYDVVVRYQGGGNAGHTVINDMGKFALHLLPSGIFRKGVMNILGNGVALDCENLVQEMETLRAAGVSVSPENLMVSSRASLLLPWHRELDALEEARLKDKKYGSTKQGIAPFYSDKYQKKTVQAGELLYPDHLKAHLQDLLEWKNLILQKVYGAKGYTMEELEQHLGDDFIKVHRSCLVAVRAIHSVENAVVLNSGEQLEYVVRQKKRILEQLQTQQKRLILTMQDDIAPANAEEYHEHYKSFDAMPFAFTDIEMVFDEERRAVDWIFRYANPALAKLEKENADCARMAAAQAAASDFGALCRRVPGPMGGVYRQKIIFLTN